MMMMEGRSWRWSQMLEAVGQVLLRTDSNEEVLSVQTGPWDVSGRRRTPVGRWCETRAVMGIKAR